MKSPLYVLPHGIEVIGEYQAKGVNRYWRVRIRPHRFFENHKVTNGSVCVRRSRVVMSSILGRSLSDDELVHHKDEDTNNDSPDNLELITAAEHNRHHKLGSEKSESSKVAVSQTLKQKYACGEMQPNHQKGEKNGCAKLTNKQVLDIRQSPEPSRKLGRIYGVSKTTILGIKNRKLCRHI